MSNIQQTDVKCPHCGTESSQHFYASANVTISPILKERILDGSLFKKTCPKCETGFDVQHDMLYHDMEQELCVWLKYEDEFGDFELEPGSERADKVFKGYNLRIVFGRNDLVEKIKLANDGHDDVLIETVKLFHSFKNQIDILSPFHYDRTENVLQKKTLLFIHAPANSSAQEHSVDLVRAYEVLQPFTPKIESALKSPWKPWLLVTRLTIFEVMETWGWLELE